MLLPQPPSAGTAGMYYHVHLDVTISITQPGTKFKRLPSSCFFPSHRFGKQVILWSLFGEHDQRRGGLSWTGPIPPKLLAEAQETT